jgi:hypothetical protein
MTGKLAVVVGAVAGMVFLFGRDAAPVKASHTKILVSSSPTEPNMVNGALFILDGDPTNDDPTTYYVWAQDVDDPQGLGAYQVEFNYISWLLSVTSLTVPPSQSNWLYSSNRSGPCMPMPPEIEEDLETGYGHGTGGCSTLGPPPPYGPQGSGLLATFSISPGITKKAHPIDFAETFLIDPGHVQGGGVYVEPQIIPSQKLPFVVYMTQCADFTGFGGNPDGIVSVNDILFVGTKFGQTGPTWDMDGNNQVTVPDILIAAREFGRQC